MTGTSSCYETNTSSKTTLHMRRALMKRTSILSKTTIYKHRALMKRTVILNWYKFNISDSVLRNWRRTHQTTRDQIKFYSKRYIVRGSRPPLSDNQINRLDYRSKMKQESVFSPIQEFIATIPFSPSQGCMPTKIRKSSLVVIKGTPCIVQ
jgi:hypothetical protein